MSRKRTLVRSPEQAKCRVCTEHQTDTIATSRLCYLHRCYLNSLELSVNKTEGGPTCCLFNTTLTFSQSLPSEPPCEFPSADIFCRRRLLTMKTSRLLDRSNNQLQFHHPAITIIFNDTKASQVQGPYVHSHAIPSTSSREEQILCLGYERIT